MSEYQIGDKLRIREWDDMEAEFGLNFFGDIDCPMSFVREMRSVCSKDFTVKSICNGKYFSVEKTEYINGFCYDISKYMLEPRTEKDLYFASEKEFNKLLGISK